MPYDAQDLALTPNETSPFPAASMEEVLGQPQIVIDLPPSADGASFRTWQGHLTFAGRTELVDPADAAAFHASTRLFMLRQFILSDSTTSHANHLVRTGEDVARTGVDHVNVSLHREGTYVGRCGGRPFRTEPGDISFIDFGQPFDFVTSPYRTLALTVPRKAMPEGLRQRAVHGVVARASLPATRLLAQLMRDTCAALPGLTLAQGIAAADAMVDLAIAVSHGDYGAREDGARPAHLDLFGRAQALIERNLGDHGLSVATLAQALSASRAALYAVFAEHGGVLSYIRERRLQRCYEILNGDDRANEMIGAIAFSLGFRSEAHFSRAFKERFGLAPRDLRIIGRGRGVAMLPAKASGVAPDRLQTLDR